jgi:tRNA uridine 5-carboxymethylaminomethyl modification enzyme
VVLTAGTFLRGRIHVGTDSTVAAGRAGEPPSVELAETIVRLGLAVERFKTGTPPRIDGRSADLARLVRQDGDADPFRFSFHARAAHPQQLPCYLTSTGPALKQIIQDHLGESALYGGAISGRGPRYCPSIEDKIVKFPAAESHQIFLEPEGLDTSEMYVNGLSTSLPPNVQLAFLRTVPGLERVRMTRPGYAIEYDYFPPTQLRPTLEVREIGGLFFAGQINGTTGYEEAAGQGAVAGINAAASVLEKDPLVLGRSDAFIGVLVDDLVTRGVDEPYRLFTSRSEFRLLLRQDNALRRLAPIAERYGLWTEDERSAALSRLEAEEQLLDRAGATPISPDLANPILLPIGSKPLSEPVRIAELTRRPGVALADLFAATGCEVDRELAEWAEIQLKYAGYLDREQASAARMGQMDEFGLPATLNYSDLQNLSFEAREKLQKARPATLGQAGRIPGVSPSDLQHLVLAVARLGVSRGTSR